MKPVHPRWDLLAARFSVLLTKRQPILYPLLDIPLSALNYAFLVFASWYLPRNAYGIVNSLLALLAITLMMGLALQTLTAKCVSALATEIDIPALFQFGGLAGLLIGGLFLTSLPLLQALTHGSGAALLAIYLTFVCNMFVSIFRGIYQGQKRFLRLNLSFYIEVFGKTVTLLLCLSWFPTITTVIGALLVGMALSLAYSLRADGPEWSSAFFTIKRQPLGPVLRQLRGIVAAQFFLQFLVTMDIIIVNYRSPYTAAAYAIVAKYGQLILFSFLSLQTVLFPLLNRAAADRAAFMPLLRSITLGYLAVSLLVIVLYHTLIPHTIPLFFGTAYGETGALLSLGAVVYCLLAFIHLLVNLFIIVGDARYLVCLAATALLTLGLNLYYAQNIPALLIAQSVVYAALALALWWIGSVHWRT